jgi:hypothetical protein
MQGCLTRSTTYSAYCNASQSSSFLFAAHHPAAAAAFCVCSGIALKTMASTANSQSVQAQDMGTGIWTFWTNTGTSVGDTKVTTVDVTKSLGATVTLAECLKRCASDSQCAGVNYAGESRLYRVLFKHSLNFMSQCG